MMSKRFDKCFFFFFLSAILLVRINCFPFFLFASFMKKEENASCRLCPEAVRRTLATMLDLSLLKSPSFMLLAISGFLCMMGFFVPFLYLQSRAHENKWEEAEAALLLSAIGISNTVARILCGFLSSLESVDANLLSNIAITLGGVTTILSGVSSSPLIQYSYSLVFGLAIGKCYVVHIHTI